MSQTGKVFFACAFGAFIGTLVSLQVAANFWWVGLIVGALTGYMAYEWKQVVGAIPVAYRKTTSWRPDTRWWKIAGERLVTFYAYSSTWCFFMALFVGLLSHFAGTGGEPRFLETAVGVGLFALISPLVASIPSALFLMLMSSNDGKLQRRVARQEEANFSRALRWNYVAVCFYQIPRGIFIAVRWLSKHLVDIAIALVVIPLAILGAVLQVVWKVTVFLGHLLRLIHSEVRLLCAMYAATGALVGYLSGNAILGAIVGGALGVLSFELISIRWLKTVPRECSLFA